MFIFLYLFSDLKSVSLLRPNDSHASETSAYTEFQEIIHSSRCAHRDSHQGNLGLITKLVQTLREHVPGKNNLIFTIIRLNPGVLICGLLFLFFLYFRPRPASASATSPLVGYFLPLQYLEVTTHYLTMPPSPP
jgi:hypothetical protein